MHYSARNLWYRMLHKQSSNKLALFQRNLPNIESDRCDLCNEVEDAKHLLISCAHKIDVWNSTFNEFLGYPKSADPHLVYNNIMLLKLDHAMWRQLYPRAIVYKAAKALELILEDYY
ncbi:hypothetical protein HMPREF1544_12023 [Mucor circinelloides 1006PhL]|uniref:Uncharacterized protein n=1 Tax=Mucor circinelloides f. circinelloides (strain 1006PhL) TaxID=1220926 RepID=S2IZE6_MUCC1|nr:hypothetical protein HMPREF1544_12023 [Mucor circinelloides 1006PhL]